MQQIKQFGENLHVLAPPVIVAVGAIALASGVHILLPPGPFGVLSLASLVLGLLEVVIIDLLGDLDTTDVKLGERSHVTDTLR